MCSKTELIFSAIKWKEDHRKVCLKRSRVHKIPTLVLKPQVKAFQVDQFAHPVSWQEEDLNCCVSNTSSFGLESFRWLGPKIWELIPDNVEHAKSLSAFKNALRKLNIDKCPCKYCRDYIHGLGYLN